MTKNTGITETKNDLAHKIAHATAEAAVTVPAEGGTVESPTYRLSTLPETVLEALLHSHHLENRDEYRAGRLNAHSVPAGAFGAGLFDMHELGDTKLDDVKPVITDSTVIWATDNYEAKGEAYGFLQPVHDVSVVVPRVDKSKEEQKIRVKERAEVFTPSWLCNTQNNMVDSVVVGEDFFNTVSEDLRSWFPTASPLDFTGQKVDWQGYLMETRLEITCGEGPYLMSPYDTTTGEGIPVRDTNGLFRRVGLLDRKLRVVTENAQPEEWHAYALLTLANTYGYEWQGDNLLLARLNFLNTYIAYHLDAIGSVPTEDQLLEVAEIASWNLWQMDGLKMVEPESCTDVCKACKTKKRAGHDGIVSVIRFLTKDGFTYCSFESLLPADMFPKR